MIILLLRGRLNVFLSKILASVAFLLNIHNILGLILIYIAPEYTNIVRNLILLNIISHLYMAEQVKYELNMVRLPNAFRIFGDNINILVYLSTQIALYITFAYILYNKL
jgi:hypothetical protein